MIKKMRKLLGKNPEFFGQKFNRLRRFIKQTEAGREKYWQFTQEE